MFVVKVNGNDVSAHTLQIDADAQKLRLIASGVAEQDIETVESDSYNPPS